MATIDQPVRVEPGETAPTMTDRPSDSLRFDYAVVALLSWFVGGMFLDGWAHNHGFVDNIFLTPWHAVLYSGYAATGALLILTQVRNVFKGYSFNRALPRGYFPALIGVVIFGLAGGADFLWHETFGFEENIEALLSPSHLALGTGLFLMISGPLRAIWGRAKTRSEDWRGMFPVIIALAGFLGLFTFFTMYASYLNRPGVLLGFRPTDFHEADLYGVTSSLIPAALMMAVFLLALRRWHRLPFGSLTLIAVVNAALMYWMLERGVPQFVVLILAAPLAVLAGEGLLAWLKPSSERVWVYRLFAFVVPFLQFLIFYVVLNQIDLGVRSGLWWKIHMWLGVPFLTGIVGVFLSFLVWPPEIPLEERV